MDTMLSANAHSVCSEPLPTEPVDTPFPEHEEPEPLIPMPHPLPPDPRPMLR